MRAYTDTGFLCSLYAPDAHTRRAATRMNRQTLPLPVIWLHRLEFRNALRLRVFRKEITPRQRDASLNMMLADLASGVLAAAEPPQADLTAESERLNASCALYRLQFSKQVDAILPSMITRADLSCR